MTTLAEAPPAAAAAIEALARRHRPRLSEALPWIIALACFFVFPEYLALGTQILISILFALSLDLILGYGGIVTLGQAAFFGVGAYTAGILAVHGWSEPLSGLVAAGVVAGAVGIVTGLILLRTEGLTLLMLTLVVAEMIREGANKAGHWTGGADGLQGVSIAPILGLFRFDIYRRTSYFYAVGVLFLAWIAVRAIVHSPFGRSLTGIRENVTRMHAIGSPVRRRLVTAYAIAAALSGVAGALLAQTEQFVSLEVLSFARSGAVVIMLILGGAGRLYGAFVGVPLYMLAQDQLAEQFPIYWSAGIGLLLVVVALGARGGVLDLWDGALAWVWRGGRR
jgi:branched-chain amino acid transport system permease protein